MLHCNIVFTANTRVAARLLGNRINIIVIKRVFGASTCTRGRRLLCAWQGVNHSRVYQVHSVLRVTAGTGSLIGQYIYRKAKLSLIK